MRFNSATSVSPRADGRRRLAPSDDEDDDDDDDDDSDARCSRIANASSSAARSTTPSSSDTINPMQLRVGVAPLVARDRNAACVGALYASAAVIQCERNVFLGAQRA